MGRIGVATSPHPKGGRLPRGVGGREPSANRRRGRRRSVGAAVMAVAGAAPATEIISVAGTAAVTLRLAPRPMGQPRPVREVSSAGGAVAGRTSQGRCPRLEPYEAKVSRTVLRGREGSNPLLLPGHRH